MWVRNIKAESVARMDMIKPDWTGQDKFGVELTGLDCERQDEIVYIRFTACNNHSSTGGWVECGLVPRGGG